MIRHNTGLSRCKRCTNEQLQQADIEDYHPASYQKIYFRKTRNVRYEENGATLSDQAQPREEEVDRAWTQQRYRLAGQILLGKQSSEY